jgi:hypothetical protein
LPSLTLLLLLPGGHALHLLVDPLLNCLAAATICCSHYKLLILTSNALLPCLALCRHVMPQAPQEWVFAGLNLLRLLLANRIAEFHTELELIPDQVSKALCILGCWGS